MAEITEVEFSKHVNSKFNLTVNDHSLHLELVEVKKYRPQEHEQPGMERFSAFFEGPGNSFVPQGVYRFGHDQMGEFDIFLVPISGDQRGYRYEAVFNYFK
ncbi:MAG TPA: hypothetical protein VE863_16725 [Pyrinomonadaceae bacterium]|nr:hypothetical protein [Pyrinomonadaceae bacterium]